MAYLKLINIETRQENEIIEKFLKICPLSVITNHKPSGDTG
jgi:hypothetical protein